MGIVDIIFFIFGVYFFNFFFKVVIYFICLQDIKEIVDIFFKEGLNFNIDVSL